MLQTKRHGATEISAMGIMNGKKNGNERMNLSLFLLKTLMMILLSDINFLETF